MKIRIGIWREYDLDDVREDMIDADAPNVSNEHIYYMLHNELAEDIMLWAKDDAVREMIDHEIIGAEKCD